MFRLFTPLFAEFDRVINSFAFTVSERVMVAITPVLRAGLILWVLGWSILIMSGRMHAPIREFVQRYLRNAIILAVALGAGYYESTVAAVVQSVPDELASVVMGDEAASFYMLGDPTRPAFDPTGAGSVQGAIIDRAAGQGIAAAQDALQKGGFFKESGVAFLTFGILILLATVAFVGLGGAIIITSKLVLGLLVALGPIFIASLLFEPARHLFGRWLSMVVTYTLVVVIFSALFTFMLGIYGHYMQNVRLDGSMNVSYAIAGALILSVVSIMVLTQIKPLAMGLGGGVTHYAFRRALLGKD